VQVLLRVTDGPAAGQRFRLRQGQVARIGRTAWADFSLPADAQLADVHFALQCQPSACLLRDLAGSERTLLNGEPVSEAALRSGDRVTAGGTTFEITLDGLSAAAESLAPGAPPVPQSAPPPGVAPGLDESVPTAKHVCASLKITDAARALLPQHDEPRSFYAALVKQSLLEDAVRFLAMWLPKPHAVWWASDCIRKRAAGQLTGPQRAAVNSAAAWAVAPSEQARRAAQEAAAALGGKTPAGWLALAAFWSTGSIGPPDAPAVPAPEEMTGRTVGNVIVLAGRCWPGKDAPADFYRRSLDVGVALLDGKLEPSAESV
jgi:hypothetical protein